MYLQNISDGGKFFLVRWQILQMHLPKTPKFFEFFIVIIEIHHSNTESVFTSVIETRKYTLEIIFYFFPNIFT